jgi:hypothetical protein
VHVTFFEHGLTVLGRGIHYAIHIRNLSPTRELDEKVPYHAWTDRKPDVSHLRIFGSVAYANMPKKVRGGKLKATSGKCQLPGYWADETKGYRLEDAETGKLITSRDVRFIEDERPTDLAIIEGDPGGSARTGELMEIQPDGSPLPVAPKLADMPTVPREVAVSIEVEPVPAPEPPVPANEPAAAPPPDHSVSVPRAPRSASARTRTRARRRVRASTNDRRREEVRASASARGRARARANGRGVT